MTRSRFEHILQNRHFLGKTKDDSSGKGYKVRSLINHFNHSFSNSVSNDDSGSIYERIVKFNGRSSMKQTISQKQTNRMELQIGLSLS